VAWEYFKILKIKYAHFQKSGMIFSLFILNISPSYSPIPLFYEAIEHHVLLKIFYCRKVQYRLSGSGFN